MSISGQIPFDLRIETPHDFSSFISNSANELLLRRLRVPADWTSPVLIVIGCEGDGKTHLARAFAAHTDGLYFDIDEEISLAATANDYVAIDDASKVSEESLFALINMALSGEILGLLLTDRQGPNDWGVELPDLRSRLSNMETIKIQPADDSVLEPIIRKLFSDYGREVDRSVVDYMLLHSARDVASLRSIVAQIENKARSTKTDVTKRFVAKALKEIT